MQVVLRGRAAAIDVVDKRSHDVHPAPLHLSSIHDRQDQNQEKRIRVSGSRSGEQDDDHIFWVCRVSNVFKMFTEQISIKSG